LGIMKEEAVHRMHASRSHRPRGILGLAGVLWVLMALPAAAAPEVPIVPIRLLFNITNDFLQPSDVAVSSSGRIFVVDGVNDRIKVCGPNGRPLSAFGQSGSGVGQFRHPLGIDVDRSGKIYVADSGNHRVQIFDPKAAFSAKIDLPGKKDKPADPTDVAVDAARGRLYVVDNDNHRFFIYDLSTRKLIKTVGAPGERELEFRYPFLMALDKKKDLFIVDVINTRVQKISPQGRFITYVGGWGVEKGHFFRPKGVAVDRSDRVYVSDSYMGVVQVFDSQGKFSGVLGEAGRKTIRRFTTPVGLCIDARNRLYVVEMQANRVGVYQVGAGGG
jgi:DNA-binding beta-propeller fold protein YncE